MTRSVLAACQGLGLDRDVLAAVGAALDLAMSPRITALADEHHPAYLHPGRCGLVLLRDVGPVAAGALVTAIVLETEDRALRALPAMVAETLGPVVAGSVSAIPLPGSPDLAERLLSLDLESSLAGLAERLDQVRHLHLRTDLRPLWRPRHEEVVSVWVPFAARVHGGLSARFARWARAFEPRLRAPGADS